MIRTGNQFKTICALVILFLSTGAAIAQSPAIIWQNNLGGSYPERAYSIRQTTPDGGYIVAGQTQSIDGQVTGNPDGVNHHQFSSFWVAKTNASGVLQWQKCLGGTGLDEAHSIEQTSDGGYFVTGYIFNGGGDVTGWHGNNAPDFWAVKLDGSGNIQWQKALGGGAYDLGYSGQQTSDSGYIVAGTAASNNGDLTANQGIYDLWVVKLDKTGSISWQKSIGGTKSERAYSISQTSDGGYIVAGESSSNDGDLTVNNGLIDFWVVKLDASGSIVWEKSLGGTANESAYSVKQTSDGGYIVLGGTQSNDGDVSGNHGGWDYWVIKFDGSGNVKWKKTYGGTADDGYSAQNYMEIQQTGNGGYVFAGYTFSNDGDVTNIKGLRDGWVVWLDSAGAILCQRTLGGSGNDFLSSVQQTADGKYIVAGTTESIDGDVDGNNFRGSSDYWVVKLESCANTNGGGGDTTAACITWDLLNDSLVTSVSGNVTGQAEKLGPGTSAPFMSVWSHNANGQELWCNTTGWVQGPLDNARYIQFDVTPTQGNAFTVNNVSFDYSDFQNGLDLNTIGFKVGYSTDNWNNVTFIGQGTYLGTSVQAFSASMNVVVPNGATFSLRIFPYGLQNQQAGSPTRATHKNVTICGGTYAGGCTYYDTVYTQVTVYDTISVYDTVEVYISVTDTLIIAVELTGMSGNPNATNALRAYPNPAHNRLIIDNGNYAIMAGYSIRVTNLLGQLVFTQPINQQQFDIDLSTWGGAGSYILSVIDPSQNVLETKTIILQ